MCGAGAGAGVVACVVVWYTVTGAGKRGPSHSLFCKTSLCHIQSSAVPLIYVYVSLQFVGGCCTSLPYVSALAMLELECSVAGVGAAEPGSILSRVSYREGGALACLEGVCARPEEDLQVR